MSIAVIKHNFYITKQKQLHHRIGMGMEIQQFHIQSIFVVISIGRNGIIGNFIIKSFDVMSTIQQNQQYL